MAFRIHQAVIRGEITNEVPGIVTGRIWLIGRSQPIVLQLQGNCMRDLAGCALTFQNPNPKPQNLDGLSGIQEGSVGQMTASQKARLPTVSEEEFVSLLQEDAQIPSRFANCLYLEWFSRSNGRVVLESETCLLHVSEPRWIPPSTSGIGTQFPPLLGDGRDADPLFHDFDAIDSEADDDLAFTEPLEAEDPEDEADADADWDEIEDDEPLDEFEWEQELREADKRVDAYQEALERFSDHVDQREIFRRYLGLDPDECDPGPDPGGRDVAEGERDPEGDRAANGASTRHHYLAERALEIAFAAQKNAEAHDLLEPADPPDAPATGESPTPVYQLVAATVQVGGKLAAALDATAHGIDAEPGFIIAMLKRALLPLNDALQGCHGALSRHAEPEAVRLWLSETRDQLFDLRREILDMMEDLRDQA